MSEETVEIKGYLVVEPVISVTGNVIGAKFAKVTGRAPQMDGDQRAVYLRLTLPKQVFYPLAEVNITVPEADVIHPEVEVGV